MAARHQHISIRVQPRVLQRIPQPHAVAIRQDNKREVVVEQGTRQAHALAACLGGHNDWQSSTGEQGSGVSSVWPARLRLQRCNTRVAAAIKSGGGHQCSDACLLGLCAQGLVRPRGNGTRGVMQGAWRMAYSTTPYLLHVTPGGCIHVWSHLVPVVHQECLVRGGDKGSNHRQGNR